MLTHTFKHKHNQEATNWCAILQIFAEHHITIHYHDTRKSTRICLYLLSHVDKWVQENNHMNKVCDAVNNPSLCDIQTDILRALVLTLTRACCVHVIYWVSVMTAPLPNENKWASFNAENFHNVHSYVVKLGCSVEFKSGLNMSEVGFRWFLFEFNIIKLSDFWLYIYPI